MNPVSRRRMKRLRLDNALNGLERSCGPSVSGTARTLDLYRLARATTHASNLAAIGHFLESRARADSGGIRRHVGAHYRRVCRSGYDARRQQQNEIHERGDNSRGHRQLSRDRPSLFTIGNYPGTLEALAMRQFTKNLVKFLKAEDGPTAVEYAVMLALIIVVCIGAITTLGNNAKSTFTSVGTTIGGTGS